MEDDFEESYLYRGTLQDEYEIYVVNAQAMGWPVKTFEEWLES